MSAPTDRDLIQRARRGEIEAFGELVRRYQTSIFNVCYRILHERAEAQDMAQESFIRAHDKLGTFDLDRPFGPWIRRVAANVCLNHLSSQKMTAELDEERDSDASGRPEAVQASRERSERVRQALASLPAQYRIVIELRHYQELSYEEIAAELKIPVSDVKSHLFRARKRLAEELHVPD